MSEPPAPVANPHLFGHAAAERAWLTAWRAGRLPHAWLLAGPRGVGKATLAYRLARAYLAGLGKEPTWNDPDAPVFRMVKSRGHPDLVVLEPATGKGKGGLWKVGEVRGALEGLYRTSTTGRRICLIDEADAVLNDEGENALLKVLEEPPRGLVFLLVAQRPGRLLRTIHSRCAALHLAPLPEPLVEEGLRRLLPDRDPAGLPRLAELGEGSIGRALEMEALDWAGGYAALLDAFAAARDEAGRLRAVTTAMRQAEGAGSFRTVSTFLAVMLRRLVRVRLGRRPALELYPGEAERLERLAGTGDLDRWFGLWEKLAALAERVEAINLDPLQAVLQIAHGICSPEAERVPGFA